MNESQLAGESSRGHERAGSPDGGRLQGKAVKFHTEPLSVQNARYYSVRKDESTSAAARVVFDVPNGRVGDFICFG